MYSVSSAFRLCPIQHHISVLHPFGRMQFQWMEITKYFIEHGTIACRPYGMSYMYYFGLTIRENRAREALIDFYLMPLLFLLLLQLLLFIFQFHRTEFRLVECWYSLKPEMMDSGTRQKWLQATNRKNAGAFFRQQLSWLVVFNGKLIFRQCSGWPQIASKLAFFLILFVCIRKHTNPAHRRP